MEESSAIIHSKYVGDGNYYEPDPDAEQAGTGEPDPTLPSGGGNTGSNTSGGDDDYDPNDGGDGGAGLDKD